MHVRQVSRHARWPSGDSKPLAVLTFEPTDLADRYGLTFDREVDDLDEVQIAAVALPDGSQAWLYKHLNDPNPGTPVRVDAAANLETATRLLRQTLGLDDADFLWVASSLEVPSARH